MSSIPSSTLAIGIDFPLSLLPIFEAHFSDQISLVVFLLSLAIVELIVTKPLDPVALIEGSRLEDPTKQIPRLKQVVGDI